MSRSKKGERMDIERALALQAQKKRATAKHYRRHGEAILAKKKEEYAEMKRVLAEKKIQDRNKRIGRGHSFYCDDDYCATDCRSEEWEWEQIHGRKYPDELKTGKMV